MAMSRKEIQSFIKSKQRKPEEYQAPTVRVNDNGIPTQRNTTQTVTNINNNTSNMVSKPETQTTVNMPSINNLNLSKKDIQKIANKNYEDKLAIFNKASQDYENRRTDEFLRRNVNQTQAFKDYGKDKLTRDNQRTALEDQQKYYKALPSVEKAIQNETNARSKAQNDLRLARYQKDVADVDAHDVNLFDQTVGQLLGGVGDYFSTITDENKYVDENGNTIYLPSKNDLMQQKIQDSYGKGFFGDLARFGGNVAHEVAKQAATRGLNMATGYGGTALYFSDIIADQYKQNINEGYDEQKALGDALLKGGANYIKQKIIGGLGGKLTGSANPSWLEDTLTKSWTKALGNETIANILSSMSAEAIDEFTDTYVESGIDAAILGKHVNADELLLDALYSGAVGGVTGAAGPAGDALINKVKTSFNRNANQNTNTNIVENIQPTTQTETPQIETKPQENINTQPRLEQAQIDLNEAQNNANEQNVQTPQQLQLDIDNASEENNNIPERKTENVISESLNETNNKAELKQSSSEETNNVIKKFDNAKKGDVFSKVEEEQGRPLRQGVKTITTATGTTELVSDMDGSVITYEPMSNKKTLDNSYERNKGKSLKQRYEDNIKFIKSDKRITADNIADIETLLVDLKDNFSDPKNVDMFLDLTQQAATLGTTDAQALQFMSVIKKLSPETQLDTLIKMVENSKAKGEKTFDGVELNKELVKKVIDAKDNETEYNKAMDNLKDDIAKQMKVGFLERVNAFRFLSMLGNVKTHGRNFFGNGLMYGLQSFKDTLGGVGESAYDTTSKLLGGKGLKERTKATFGSLRASKEIRNYVNNEVDNTFKNQKNNSKYSESKNGMLNDIKGRRKMFTEVTPLGKMLNFLATTNTKLLDVEDKLFSKAMTKQAMKSYLVANGIKSNADIEANPELIGRALDYAIFKGEEATYHQDSKTATAINNFKETAKSGSGFTKAVGLATEATMPFVKTPVNIAKTALEYTPVVGFGDLNSQLKSAPKELRGAVVIDSLSKQFAGLALMGVGIALANSNVVKIKGAGDGEKEDEIEKDLGNANYSIKIGDSTYDLSWLAPTAIPLFEGVEIYNQYAKGGNIDANTLIDTIFGALDPVQDMSVLQSVQRLISSLGSNSKNKKNLIQSAASETFSSYLSQYIPTFLSQVAEFTDDKKRDTNTDKTVLGKTFNQIKYKIPYARQTLPESVDIWGETKKTADNKGQRFFEAFLSPANRKDYKVDETTKALEELAHSTGETSVLPTKREQSLTINKEKYALTGHELSQYKKTFGQTSKSQIENLMKDQDYINADDDTKRKMIESIYEYANYKYKKEYADSHGIDYNDKSNKYALVDAFDVPYYELESMRLGDTGKTKKQEKINTINSTDLTDEQKDMINLIQSYKYYDADINALINKINNSNLSNSQKAQLINKIKTNGTNKKNKK